MNESGRRWNRTRLLRVVTSAFVLFNLLAIVSWSVPIESPLILAMRGWFQPYMRWSGLFQSWNMFAPNPRSINAYVEAAVITRNGTVRNWKFPRMEQLSVSERFVKERYRKFVENLPEQKYSAIWPDVARHIARSCKDSSNPPEIVMLIRYWTDIQPPAKFDVKPPPIRAHIFFEYKVLPEDVR